MVKEGGEKKNKMNKNMPGALFTSQANYFCFLNDYRDLGYYCLSSQSKRPATIEKFQVEFRSAFGVSGYVIQDLLKKQGSQTNAVLKNNVPSMISSSSDTRKSISA